MNQENAEKYSMYGVSSFVTKAESQDKQVVFEEIATGPRVWQVTELLYDFALLNERAGYGYVDDLIFSREGKLVAVVVNPDYGNTPGRYAYPYYGFDYGFDPGAPFYSLGYGKDEAAELKPFDDKKLRN